MQKFFDAEQRNSVNDVNRQSICPDLRTPRNHLECDHHVGADEFDLVKLV